MSYYFRCTNWKHPTAYYWRNDSSFKQSPFAIRSFYVTLLLIFVEYEEGDDDTTKQASFKKR